MSTAVFLVASVVPGPTASAQEPRICWYGARVAGPYVALTFDDGPDAVLTPQLLDILKARHIRATFFVVGQNAAKFPELVRRESDEGHEIGSHSWDHPNLAQLDDSLLHAELDETRRAILAACGRSPVVLRPPYGSLTAGQQLRVHEDFGYPTILWDVNSRDWRHLGPAVVEQRILGTVHPGAIILDHDTQTDAIQAMPDTLDKMLAGGFKFVTVSELIAMDQPVPR